MLSASPYLSTTRRKTLPRNLEPYLHYHAKHGGPQVSVGGCARNLVLFLVDDLDSVRTEKGGVGRSMRSCFVLICGEIISNAFGGRSFPASYFSNTRQLVEISVFQSVGFRPKSGKQRQRRNRAHIKGSWNERYQRRVLRAIGS